MHCCFVVWWFWNFFRLIGTETHRVRVLILPHHLQNVVGLVSVSKRREPILCGIGSRCISTCKYTISVVCTGSYPLICGWYDNGVGENMSCFFLLHRRDFLYPYRHLWQKCLYRSLLVPQRTINSYVMHSKLCVTEITQCCTLLTDKGTLVHSTHTSVAT